MKLFLFGGAETGQARAELKMIEKVINTIAPKQLLHIPFSRTKTSEAEWQGDWFGRNITLKNTQYLNAGKVGDLAKAKTPLVFISGGSQHVNLMKKIKSDPKLLKFIKNAEYLIGESAGGTFLGEYRLSKKPDGSSKIIKQLGIIKDTVIMPHYTPRKRQKALAGLMEETKVKYGIGIDSITAMQFDLEDFPKKFKKIGKGNVIIKKSSNVKKGV